jgi:primosomal protein N'
VEVVVLRELFVALCLCCSTVPAPIARMRGEYRWQILLCAARMKAINDAIRSASKAIKWPKTVKVTVDVDATLLL